MKNRIPLHVQAFLWLAPFWPLKAGATVVFWEELPYFSAQDSPFYAGIQSGDIYLEDFEDHALNTPYIVSWDSPRIIGIVNGFEVPSRQRGDTLRNFGATNGIYSVDGDDGLLGDFKGFAGDTWATTSTSVGGAFGFMEFRFEPDPSGRYPTFVGFVVTETLNSSRDFEFGTSTFTGPESSDNTYDPLSWNPTLSFPGDTRAHRFFGIHASSGISILTIDNVRQIDHLQYGYAIPEPEVGLLAFAAVILLLNRRCR
jgi:hypothetical protein